MKHLTILVPEGENNLSSIVGCYKIITRANEYWQRQGKSPVFQIQLAGVSKEVTFHGGLFAAFPTNIRSIRKTDLIIIPSLNHNFVDSVNKNKTLIHWIHERHNHGAEIASICTGAFLLASTGLLNGRQCATHWSAAEVFRKMFPSITVLPDSVVTDEHGLYTNGGAYSFLHLVLYLVEKFFDRKTAIYCSKVFQIDPERNSQAPFTIFNGLKEHDDNEIMRAQLMLEKAGEKKISMEDIASKVAIGRRNFDRRFKRATGHTPVEYMQKVKVERAKRELETGNKNITRVMMDAGYTDPKAFREVFRKITGLSPLEYRNKFRKDRQAMRR